MIRRWSFLVILPLTLIGAARPAMFPPKVMDWDEVMSDWFAPGLEKMGERPLWLQGAVGRTDSVYRFTFIGNMCRSTSIRIDEATNRIDLQVVSLDRCKRGSARLQRSNRRIAPTDWADAKRLMEEAELWKFEIGDWDDDGEIWIDCTFLVMERAAASDYRMSRSQISCMQPRRLLAVVNKVAALAALSRPSLGYLDRSQGDATD